MDKFNPVNKLPSPDFSQMVESNKKSSWRKIAFLIIKIILALVVAVVIVAVIWGLIFINDLKQAYKLSFDAKSKLELAIHDVINRDFKDAADLITQANTDFIRAKNLISHVWIYRYIPYAGRQYAAVDKMLEAGIDLTTSSPKVVLLIDDIVAPLKNESISYDTLSSAQKREILNKIVAAEPLLIEVQKQIDEATLAIDSIPENGLLGPIKSGVLTLKDNLPQIKDLIDHSLPMLRVLPQIVGFDQPKSYLFLLQNNTELRPTGGFIGTYGILKLQDGDIKEFQTDNVYNLDRATQPVLQIPSPAPIVKYLEQKNWSLRDSNWSPDFPTTAQEALYLYTEENRTLAVLEAQGKKNLGEKGEVIETIPYQEVDGVIAMTPEVIEDLLKLTGPVTVDGYLFTDQNLVDQLEFIVGQQYKTLGISAAQRKGVINDLANQIKLKILSFPLQRIKDLLNIAYKALAQKEILIYAKDQNLEQLVLARNWGGAVKNSDLDYLMVVDSNLASLKTDQYVGRTIDYTFKWQGSDLIATTKITYKNNADFTWKSTRLRSYTRVYVPAGSQLINSSGALADDKIKDPAHTPGQVETGQELNKTYFGAFISIEPHEIGVLTFEYKLPQSIKDAIKNNNYTLLVQKQPGVIPNLTLTLNFDKNIKSAIPGEVPSEWSNTNYKYSTPLDQDKMFNIILK